MVSLFRVLGTNSIESIEILDVVAHDGPIDGSSIDGSSIGGSSIDGSSLDSSQFVCVVVSETSGKGSTVVGSVLRILSRSAVIVSAWAARAAEYMSRCWYRRRRKRSANSETIRSMSGSADMRRCVRRRLEVSAARVLSERRVF